MFLTFKGAEINWGTAALEKSVLTALFRSVFTDVLIINAIALRLFVLLRLRVLIPIVQENTLRCKKHQQVNIW